MSALIIDCSPLTNRIRIGRVNKKGDGFSGEPQDVTGAACAAVAQYALRIDAPVMVHVNGRPVYEITVTKIDEVKP